MVPLRKNLLAILVCSISVSAAMGDSAQNRIWFLWEQRGMNPDLCSHKNHCDPVSSYTPRLAEETSDTNARNMFTALEQLAAARNLPADHPEGPQICQHTDAAAILGFEAESWPISEKTAALHGLQGVYFKLDTLTGPPNYQGEFGQNVHDTVVAKFNAANIPVLTEEEMENTPGKPHLNIFFSNTNPDTGCWFSVFASLSQTMLLTRNHTTKIKGGTWGFSGGFSPDNPDIAEFDAIMTVVDKFIGDFLLANPDGVAKRG